MQQPQQQQHRPRMAPAVVLAVALLLLVVPAAPASGSSLASAASASGAAGKRPCSAEGATAGLPFCDPSLPLDDRIEDLLSRLTFDEKVREQGGGVGWGATVVVGQPAHVDLTD